MPTKLTLSVDETIIENAKRYAAKNRVSLSKMVEFYFKSLTTGSVRSAEPIPPITSELSGIAEIKTRKTDKELLVEALSRRHGHG